MRLKNWLSFFVFFFLIFLPLFAHLQKLRIREVEHSYFTPLVFSASGEMGHEASAFYKRLASLLSDKWNDPYAIVLGWIRCRLSFCLLRSAIQCIRGARSSQGHYIKSAPVALVQPETQFLINCLTVYLYVLILFSLYLQKKKKLL